ncbi:MAG: tRNA (adenosine(37)-N6)-threonylcarbamoyltransferase complex ATPase subunit type 1 TsaE, partial [Kiloniellales bacterium]|nr:tRNA (adenosine(37)-N6)-threonylcarbamoyltransferase complex ATPase subunit type 1 TsaE [Kiloniellales bacterium]
MVNTMRSLDGIRVSLKDEMDTKKLAEAMAKVVRKGDIIALWGGLGAGKTAFARFFINAIPDTTGNLREEEVPSPTFTMVQIYERTLGEIWHLDLYRLES